MKPNRALAASQGFLLLTLGVVCLVYFPGLSGPFIFDDLGNILENYALRVDHLSFDTLLQAATSREGSGFGRPLAMASFAINYHFTKFDPYYFKLFNLGLHLVTGLGIFWLARLLTTLSAPLTNSAVKTTWVPLLVFAAWLVHPIHITTVLYPVQRMTGLAVLFTVYGLITYLLGRNALVAGRRIGIAYIIFGLFGCGLLAVLSKESGVLIFGYAFVIELIFYRFQVHDSLGRKWRLYLASLFVIPAVVALVYVLEATVSGSLIGGYAHRRFTLEERLLTESRVLWIYLKLILLPIRQDFGLYHDDLALSRSLTDPSSTLFAALGLIGLTLAAVALRRRLPIFAFAVLWFLIGHSLESTILPLEIMHEHRNYLPSFGILFGLIYGANHLARDGLRPIGMGLIVAYCVLFAGVTYARAVQWKDALSLYAGEVKNHPKSVSAQTALAVFFHDNRRYELADPHFAIAASLDTEAESMMRLIQHNIIAGRKIDPSLIAELERRVRAKTYSSVTLWTLEPLIHDSAKHPELQLSLLRIYEEILAQPSIQRDLGWRVHGELKLALTYRGRGERKTADSHLAKAIAADPTLTYYLTAVDSLIAAKQIEEAKALVIQLKKSDLRLNEPIQHALREREDALGRAQ